MIPGKQKRNTVVVTGKELCFILYKKLLYG